MLTPDELRALCHDLRNQKTRTDDALIARITQDVREYRRILAGAPTQLPPERLAERLPLMGWLIYETSWECTQRIQTSFNRTAAAGEEQAELDAERARSETAVGLIKALVDAATGMPWPEFAPRALGAIRALALAESKRDSIEGYDAAWVLHEEGLTRHDQYRESHGTRADRERFTRDLDEVLLQLALAETGTACRTAERVISRWAEEFRDGRDAAASAVDEHRWLQRMFGELTKGVTVGERAIATARDIAGRYGFVDKPSEFRLALPTALQNPGIMTARAALLLIALAPAMEHQLGRTPPKPHEDWKTWEEHALGVFTRAYEAIEEPVINSAGEQVEMKAAFRRQLVHMRLNLALLKPGYHLPSKLAFDPCLAMTTLDGQALEVLSAYLAGPEGTAGRERSIGAATMPAFIRSVAAGRSDDRDERGYQGWRVKWFRLDQFSKEQERWRNVMGALTEVG